MGIPEEDTIEFGDLVEKGSVVLSVSGAKNVGSGRPADPTSGRPEK
jgi:hypothetical protein